MTENRIPVFAAENLINEISSDISLPALRAVIDASSVFIETHDEGPYFLHELLEIMEILEYATQVLDSKNFNKDIVLDRLEIAKRTLGWINNTRVTYFNPGNDKLMTTISTRLKWRQFIQDESEVIAAIGITFSNKNEFKLNMEAVESNIILTQNACRKYLEFVADLDLLASIARKNLISFREYVCLANDN